MRTGLLISLVALAILAVTVRGQDETGATGATGPLLAVEKTVKDYYVVKGDSIAVSLVITNYGASPAFNLQISDGDRTGVLNVDVLAPGANWTTNYTIPTSTIGDIPLPRAKVQYQTSPDDKAQLQAASNELREEEAYHVDRRRSSTPELLRGVVSVVTRERYDRMHTKYIKESIAYLVIGAVSVLFPFLVYRTKQNQVDLLIRQRKK